MVELAHPRKLRACHFKVCASLFTSLCTNDSCIPVASSSPTHTHTHARAHEQKNSEICTYSYPDIILAVKLNRQRLVVVLKQNLYIHNIRDMKVHTVALYFNLYSDPTISHKTLPTCV